MLLRGGTSHVPEAEAHCRVQDVWLFHVISLEEPSDVFHCPLQFG